MADVMFPSTSEEWADDNLTTEPVAKAKAAGRFSPWMLLSFLASLRVTVVLFVFAFILVFVGTLAQKNAGIWTVVNTYFRECLVWVPLQIFFTDTFHVPGGFYFPGGWAIGAALLVNLLAAHAVRFKFTWKRIGILLIHSGLVVMMLSEFITGMFAVEGTMTIVQGSTSNYLELHDRNELAITRSDGQVTTISDRILKKGGVIQDAPLPFDIEVVRYLPNSDPPTPAKGDNNPATAGDGRNLVAIEAAPVSGTDPNAGVDVPAAYVTFKRRGTGESLGTYLISQWWSEFWQIYGEPKPQTIDVGGEHYQIYLQPARIYKPYTIYLKKFTHKIFKETDIPIVFASTVRLINPETHEEREVDISMNKPLSYNGETFYQQAWLPEDSGTRLQVVRNPGWLMPYISCLMVSLGMLFHFGLHLSKFLRVKLREARKTVELPGGTATIAGVHVRGT